MKKRDLATLAMIGVSAGLLIGGCQQGRNTPPRSNTAAAEQVSPDMQSFYSSLSADSKRKFMELDNQHRMMAIEMANQSDYGQNQCSGMGGCKADGHGGPVSRDPNKAVDAQYKNQMQQRGQMNNGMGGNNNPSGYQNNGNRNY